MVLKVLVSNAASVDDDDDDEMVLQLKYVADEQFLLFLLHVASVYLCIYNIIIKL